MNSGCGSGPRSWKRPTRSWRLRLFGLPRPARAPAPYRRISGAASRKSGKQLDEQSRHYMDTISEAAQKMGLLIDDLLSFSRMGRHAMSFQPVELESLVHEVIRELEPDAAGRNIEWRIGDLPAVSGDAAMLRMVLTNLIANALKFTRPRQAGPNRNRVHSRPGCRSRYFRARQRRRFRHGLCGQALRRVPAPAPRRGIRGHRHRVGQCAPHHRPARRPDLGGRKDRPGRYILLFAAADATRRWLCKPLNVSCWSKTIPRISN